MDLLQHLKNRNFDTLLHRIYISDDTISFPLYTFDKKWVGYQQYRPEGSKKVRKDPKEGKYFTYSSEPSIWGLDFVTGSKTIVICEGIFKACRFHSHGIQAIATLTNNPKHLIHGLNRLKLMGYTIIVVPDPDKAGMKLIKYGTHYVIPTKPVDKLTEDKFAKLAGLVKQGFIWKL